MYIYIYMYMYIHDVVCIRTIAGPVQIETGHVTADSTPDVLLFGGVVPGVSVR